jgi:hypothetical protein
LGFIRARYCLEAQSSSYMWAKACWALDGSESKSYSIVQGPTLRAKKWQLSPYQGIGIGIGIDRRCTGVP